MCYLYRPFVVNASGDVIFKVHLASLAESPYPISGIEVISYGGGVENGLFSLIRPVAVNTVPLNYAARDLVNFARCHIQQYHHGTASPLPERQSF